MFDSFIQAASGFYQVPAAWIQAIIDTESGWNPNASNPADPSYGLMGMTPTTARDMGYTGTIQGLYDPETNINLGTKYVRWVMDRWGVSDFQSVYSAYNSGSPTLWQQSQEVALHVATALANLSKYVTWAAWPLVALGALILWRKKR